MTRASDMTPILSMRAFGKSGGLGQDVPGQPPRSDPQFDSWVEINTWKDSPPPIHSWFDKAEEVTILGNASRQRITAFKIPQASLGVLRFFANQTANPSDTQFITFACVVDGTPIPGYANIIGSKGPINAPDPVVWPLYAGQVLEVIASNSQALAISGVAARIKGWYWPVVSAWRESGS